MVDVAKRYAIVDEEEKRTSQVRTRRLNIGASLLVLICIFLPPALYRPSASGKLPFDGRYLAEINAIRPDYTFIGNSMLRTRIDEATLEARFGKNCCYVMWTAGAESAWTYQAFKNVVLAAEHRPKKVFVFFRDTLLTMPAYRATDRYWWRIERLSHSDEPELLRAMREDRTWQERLEYSLGSLYPIQKRRENANYLLGWLASQIISPGKVAYGEPTADDFNDLFALEKLRTIELADDAALDKEDQRIYDFNRKVRTSLLPSMLSLAKEAKVELVFVRVQRRPSEDGPPPQSEALKKYISDFKSYVTAQGADFYDFTGDPALTLNHYLDGDHIRPDWRVESTKLFVKRLERHFK